MDCKSADDSMDEFLRKINSGSEKKFMDIIQSGHCLVLMVLSYYPQAGD